MGDVRQVLVPDIGDFKEVPVIELQVKPGDRVEAEAALITLESDKASMEVPSPYAGVVKSVAIKIGDRVSQGTPILSLELDGVGSPADPVKPAVSSPPAPTSAPTGVAEVRVPDIGEFKEVPIIEVMVKAGDTVKPEQPLVTLESDKASMEVPSPLGGVVQELKIKLGDRVSEGTVLLTLTTGAAPTRFAPSTAPSAAAAPAPSVASVSDISFTAVTVKRSGIRDSLCRSVGSQARARARYRPSRSQGHRTPRADPAGRRREFRQGAGCRYVRATRSGRSCARPVALAKGRLRQVWAYRDQAALPHQEDLRCQLYTGTG